MATLIVVLDVETEAEGVFGNYIANTLGIAYGVKSDSNTEQMTPRVEIVATRQQEGWHQTTIASGTYAGRTLYDQFKVRLQLDLVYNPAAAQGQANYRGNLRKAMTDFNGLQTGFAVNNLYLLAPDTLRQTDGDRVIENAEKTETIKTTLEMELFLVPSALTSAT